MNLLETFELETFELEANASEKLKDVDREQSLYSTFDPLPRTMYSTAYSLQAILILPCPNSATLSPAPPSSCYSHPATPPLALPYPLPLPPTATPPPSP